MGHSLAFDRSTDIAMLPISHIPAVTDADDCAVLSPVAHHSFPFFSCALLRSRAATAFFAIRLRSSADSFSALAFPPLLAILAISEGLKYFARALPPRLPSACACGFFFWPMHRIILLSTKHVKGNSRTIRVFWQATRSAWVTPTQTGHTAQAGYKGCGPLAESGRGYGSESRTRALSNGMLVPPNRSVRGPSRCYGTSIGHQPFLSS